VVVVRRVWVACFVVLWGVGGAALAALAQESGVTWSQFQGGPTHLGTVEEGSPEPPLELAWRFDDPVGVEGLSGAIVVEDLVVAVGSTHVYGIDLGTGEERFSVDREKAPIADPAVGEVEGRTVLAFTEGQGENAALVGLDLESRERLWTTPLEGASRGGVAVDSGRAYAGDSTGRLYAVDLATGEQAWFLDLGGRVEAAPAVAGGRVFAVSRDPDGGEVSVAAVDQESGEVSWTFRQSLSSAASAVTLSPDAVFVGLGNGTVRGLDIETGAELWEARIRSGVSPFTGPALAGQSVLLADLSAGLYRLDAGSGDRQWDHQFDSTVVRGAPLVVGDTAYLGLDDGSLVAVEMATGDLVWQRGTGSGSLGAIAVARDMLVVKKGGRTGGLVAFRHDAEGQLVRIPSPTKLRLGAVLGYYAVAAAAVFAVVFVAFGVLLRRSVEASSEEPGPGPEGTASFQGDDDQLGGEEEE
jgi:outer membrane protein assembly factor BamB